MVRRNATVDELLNLKDAGLVAADAAGQVGGADKILDLGAGFVEGRLIIDISALELDGVRSQGTLTMDTNPTDGDTITIGAVTYTFKDTPASAGHIKIGVNVAATQVSLVKTINGTGIAGTDYFAGTTTPHPTVSAGNFAANASVLTARTAGVAGDTIATTETFTAGTNVFDAATLGTTRAGAAGNERYDILLQGSNSASFASGIVVLARVAVGIAALVNAGANTGTGRIVLPFTNEFMGTLYQYARVYTDVTGADVASGVNYTARIAKED